MDVDNTRTFSGRDLVEKWADVRAKMSKIFAIKKLEQFFYAFLLFTF